MIIDLFRNYNRESNFLLLQFMIKIILFILWPVDLEWVDEAHYYFHARPLVDSDQTTTLRNKQRQTHIYIYTHTRIYYAHIYKYTHIYNQIPYFSSKQLKAFKHFTTFW